MSRSVVQARLIRLLQSRQMDQSVFDASRRVEIAPPAGGRGLITSGYRVMNQGELGVAKQIAPVSDFNQLLEQAADEERRLLKLERKAEKRVAALRSDLAKAQERFDAVQVRHDELQAQVDLRAKELADAEAALARHHAARATGPNPAAEKS